MSKKKKNNKIFPTEFVLDEISEYTYAKAIKTIKTYLAMMDGSILSDQTELEIYNLFLQHSELMKLICCACEEDGYNSF